MNKFILVHGIERGEEMLIKKEKIIDIIQMEGGTDIDAGSAVYHVTETPSEILAMLQEPDAIITTDGRVYK